MVQLTERDDLMLAWLETVRLADVQAIRWALAGLSGEAQPTSTRRAQQWAARLVDVGMLGRKRPTFNASTVVWPTREIGSRMPDLYRNTARHELAVAAVSARYLARGYEWRRDRRAQHDQDHQADGVALKDGIVDLVEVELHTKTLGRYKLIHTSHAQRLTTEVSRVVYLCTPESARAVAREADRLVFRDLRPRLVTLPVLNQAGIWVGSDDAIWAMPNATAPAPAVPELWDRGIA